MRLDSIVYDYSSLQSAIIDTLNEESPAFKAIYPSDTATSLTNVLASYGAMLQYQLVSAMANCYTDSAYSKAGVYQLAETLGNRLHGNISSQVFCNITRTNLKGISNIVIPAGSKFKVENLNFFNPESIVFPLELNTISNVKLVQGTLLVSEQISSGISGEKMYFCDDFKCNTNMVRVFVNDEEWDIADSFLPYVVTDNSIAAETQVVILKTDSDGRTYIKFGNNSNGIIPAKGSVIRIEYVSNEGADGNLNNNELQIKLDTPIFYTTSPLIREQLTVDITAVSTASGGFNTQSLEVLRQSSPFVFASGQRAVRRNDYKTMLLNQCGYLTANVWGEYEEAAIQGGYDKIMMNMVYYSGIKSIQKYDLQPIKTLDISLTEINEIYTTNVYNVSGNIPSARGFLGSYIIDISSYDSDGLPITLKYRDYDGTGILTCDPSVNNTLADFDTKIFPNNDILDKNIGIRISTNQKILTAQNDPEILLQNGGEYISSGLTENGQPMIINFDNPFQIKLDFAEKLPVVAFAFKTPTRNEDYKKFMHQFAIYGTNLDIPISDNDTYYNNVKNNAQWVKLTGMHTFDTELPLDGYSDWITTNVYSPGISVTEEENLSSQCAEASTNTFTLHTLINKDYSYTVKVNQLTQPANTYTINSNTGELIFNDVIPIGSQVMVYGTLYDWLSYKHYLIEIYTLHDTSTKTPRVLALQQIKALYKETASTINYNSNNSVNLNIPIIENENLVRGYTVVGKPQLSNDWLVDKDGVAITPDPSKLYYVTDTHTYDNIVTIANNGSNYVDGDQIQIQFYNYSYTEGLSQSLAINNAGVGGYEKGETFTILGKAAQILEVTAAGMVAKAGFVDLDKYTSIETVATNVGMDPDSYHGVGTGATFDINPALEPGNSSIISPITIKPIITTNEDNEIVELNTNSFITCYDATTTASISCIPGETASGSGATFNIVSTKNNTLYNGKLYNFDPNTNQYVENTIALVKTLGLPETMQYYEYKVTINGATEDNGYRTGNILYYNITSDNITYTFKAQINNINAEPKQDISITLGTDSTYQSPILRGKSGLNINNAELSTEIGSAAASGATITINSESTVNVTGSYTGNFYTESDIQAFDLPVINKYNHFTTYLEFKQPHIKNVQIELNIEYENVTTYQTVKNNVIKAINALFELQPYSIGSGLNVSDIWKAVNKVEGIKRFNVITPLDNITCMPYEVLMLPAENLIINDILNSEYK